MIIKHSARTPSFIDDADQGQLLKKSSWKNNIPTIAIKVLWGMVAVNVVFLIVAMRLTPESCAKIVDWVKWIVGY